jgi:hypothetical protein
VSYFCCSPAGATLLVATLAFQVMQSDIPHRGPDMSSRDMRLVAASDEAAGSEWSEPFAWGLCGPLGCCGSARPATNAALASPTSVRPCCRLLSATTAALASPTSVRPCCRLLSVTTAALASPISVRPCCRPLSAASSPVDPWASGQFQTDDRTQGDGWGTQTGRLTWKAGHLSCC